VRNKITFVLQNPELAKSPAARNQAITGEPDPSMRPQFWQILAPAFEHVDAGDLLRAELVLDEAFAAYALNPEESRALRKFYGFIYARLEDYERAIAAYESAVAIPGGWGNDSTLLTIASLHFKRQQYAEALESAQRYIELSDNPIPGAYQFVETLRQLGIAVDDTL
jgi:tetratricopeptide (TPR) repeat protein